MNLLEYGLDIKHRRIFLSGDIENGKTDAIIRSLILLADRGPSDITLVVQSPGGDMNDTFAIYDTIKSIPNNIRTIALGHCESSASLLVAAGTPGQRISLPNCHFMVHDIWIEGTLDASTEVASKEVRQTKRLRNKYLELMTANTKTSLADWRKICRRAGDSFFAPTEALKYGIIDRIEKDNIWCANAKKD
jgi:ATP-dependent Clp protease protease subunit